MPPAKGTTLFLVRHAAHPDLGRRLTGRASGVPLSPAGERQAAALAERLRGEGLEAVHASPRRRARATAEAIATRSAVPLRLAEALDEIDFGDWTGLSFAELSGRPLWRRWNEARASASAPNGESMEAAVARVAAYAEGIAEARPGQRLALVTHCDIIRGLVANCLGLNLNDMLRFDIAPASISRIEVGARGARVVSLNETLPEEGAAEE